MAARMPIITMTMRSSTMVKPRVLVCLFLLFDSLRLPMVLLPILFLFKIKL